MVWGLVNHIKIIIVIQALLPPIVTNYTQLTHCMITSSNGKIFSVTGPLCGEFIGPRWIPSTNARDAGLLMFSLICAWINGSVSNREAGDLRRHRIHYDVTIMELQKHCRGDQGQIGAIYLWYPLDAINIKLTWCIVRRDPASNIHRKKTRHQTSHLRYLFLPVVHHFSILLPVFSLFVWIHALV